jgi:hypothetical protein
MRCTDRDPSTRRWRPDFLQRLHSHLSSYKISQTERKISKIILISPRCIIIYLSSYKISQTERKISKIILISPRCIWALQLQTLRKPKFIRRCKSIFTTTLKKWSQSSLI